ncbi:MAG TPA: bifunctional nicotinamidase/pyrazinamidase [Stellaceae bacterium]|nr:bifunctional nicotinamidase/pyrazinamidase [Stellaceae bacterium]
MIDRLAPTDSDALLVVDVQNDFCAGGRLAVPRGEEIVPAVNRLARSISTIVLTQDWHPRDHRSFASQHAGQKPYDVVAFPYGPQILWPDHCVQGTEGAAFCRDLDIPGATLVIRKGFRREIDSYSTFFENDRRTPTGLQGYLRERGMRRVFVAGLAFDFCVGYSALDAARLGFETCVIEDACRAIDVDGSEAATRKSLAEAGVALVCVDRFG